MKTTRTIIICAMAHWLFFYISSVYLVSYLFVSILHGHGYHLYWLGGGSKFYGILNLFLYSWLFYLLLEKKFFGKFENISWLMMTVFSIMIAQLLKMTIHGYSFDLYSFNNYLKYESTVYLFNFILGYLTYKLIKMGIKKCCH